MNKELDKVITDMQKTLQGLELKGCPWLGCESSLHISETPKALGPPKFGFKLIPKVFVKCDSGCGQGKEYTGKGAGKKAVIHWNRRK